MRIPIDMLEPETLRNVIENFIAREGTDYGAQEVTLLTKIDQVTRQLRSGKAILVFDAATESCNIIIREQYDTQASHSEPCSVAADQPDGPGCDGYSDLMVASDDYQGI